MSTYDLIEDYTYKFKSIQVAEVREFIHEHQYCLIRTIKENNRGCSSIESRIRAKIALKITNIIERSHYNFKITDLEEGIETEDGECYFLNPITLDIYNGLDIKDSTCNIFLEYLKLKILLDKEKIHPDEFSNLHGFKKHRKLKEMLYEDLLQLFFVR